jgi:hypothetical protein
MGEPATTESDRRPQAVVLSYKKVEEHPRITRIATTVAETGRDVLILGLSGTVEQEEFVVSPQVHGVGLPKFNLYAFLLRQSLRPLNALQRGVDALRWRS